MEQATPLVCLAYSDDEDYVSFDEEELNTGIADLYDDDSASDYNEDSEEADVDNLLTMEAEMEAPQLQPPQQAMDDFLGLNVMGLSPDPVPAPAPIPSGAPVPLSGGAAPPPSAAPVPSGAPVPHHFPTPLSGSSAMAMPQPPPQSQSAAPIPKPAKRGASLFGTLFNSKVSDDEDEDEDDDDCDGDEFGGMDMNYRSQARSASQNDPFDSFSVSAIGDGSANGSAMRSASSKLRSAPKRRGKKEKKKKGKKSKTSQLNKRLLRLQQKPQRMEKRKKKVVHRQKVNTNIIQIDLGTLKEAADNIATGDAFKCSQCGAVLSIHDELVKQLDDIKLDDEDESIWKCTFCNHINVIEIDDEERPTSETVDYILAPPPTLSEEAKTDSSDTPESQILFCIDISGSMCVSQQIDAKHSHFKLKGNHLSSIQDDLSQFIDHNANHLNRANDIQYVSRLQCVQTAVDEQIEAISKSHPHYKLGLVTFNNEVTVIGDGVGNQVTVAGDKLNDLDKLKEIGSGCTVGKNVGECKDKLSKALWSLKETGQTALGPALAVSIAMASSKPGSQVILCTDGLANVGVGSLEIDENAQNQNNGDNNDEEIVDPILQWYQALGDYAVANGVIVNIISITDDGCRLENLGKIVEVTNGTMKRINPLNLAEKFSGIIQNESIATNCQARMIMHPGLKFHDSVEAAKLDLDKVEQAKVENLIDDAADSAMASNSENAKDPKSKDSAASKAKSDDNETKTDDKVEVEKQGSDEANSKVDKLNDGRTIYTVSQSLKDCGNVFEGSRIFFEYVVDKAKSKQFRKLKELPFQVQIEYQKKDGSKMLRVISQMKKVTLDRKEVRNNLNFDLLATHGTHVTTELCAKGDYESSRMYTASNVNFMRKHAVHRGHALAMANYAQENVALDHAMNRRLQTESMAHYMEPPRGGGGMSFSAAPMGAPPASGGKKKKGRKKMLSERGSARNDTFSSHMYTMKSKSRK